jgi:hypothetical protein
MQSEKTKLLKQNFMRSQLTTLLFIARLSWGELLSPLNWTYNLIKIFPPPRKSVYKQGVVNYFFRN